MGKINTEDVERGIIDKLLDFSIVSYKFEKVAPDKDEELIVEFLYDIDIWPEDLCKDIGDYLFQFFKEKNFKADFVGFSHYGYSARIAEEISDQIMQVAKAKEENNFSRRIIINEIKWELRRFEKEELFNPDSNQVILIDVYPERLKRAIAFCVEKNIKVEKVILVFNEEDQLRKLINSVEKSSLVEDDFYLLFSFEKIYQRYLERG